MSKKLEGYVITKKKMDRQDVPIRIYKKDKTFKRATKRF